MTLYISNKMPRTILTMAIIKSNSTIVVHMFSDSNFMKSINVPFPRRLQRKFLPGDTLPALLLLRENVGKVALFTFLYAQTGVSMAGQEWLVQAWRRQAWLVQAWLGQAWRRQAPPLLYTHDGHSVYSSGGACLRHAKIARPA